MRLLASTLFIVAIALFPTLVQAQPGTDHPPSTTEPTSPAPVTPVPIAPSAQAQAPQAPDTSLYLQDQFDSAAALLLKNRFEEAIQRYESIAQRSTREDAKKAAWALADLARLLKSKHAYISTGTANRQRVLAAPDEAGGRTKLVINTTLAAFYSSFALVDILGIDDFTPISLTVAATTGAGLGLSLYLSRKANLHPATASAYSTGLIAGVANGLLLAPVLGIDINGGPGDGDVNQNYLLFGLTTMAAGATAGYMLGTKYRPTEGQVTTATMAGVSGFASTALFLGIIQPDDIREESMLALLALGMDAGLAGGAFFGKDIDWSASRANYVALSQVLGALGGFTLGAAIIGSPDGNNESRVYTRVYAGMVLSGIWLGLAGGIYVTRDMEPDTSIAQRQNVISLQPLLGKDLQGLAVGGQF